MSANYANRGSHLEELVRLANAQYLRKGQARIDKFPTPIAPERVTSGGKVYGHYEKKSTVDYIGAVKSGAAVCFDCKETSSLTSFPLKNVRQHQIDYMKDIHKMGGHAFILVYFARHGKYFRMDFWELHEIWKAYNQGGAASIPLKAFSRQVLSEKGYCLHYLKDIV